MGEVIKYNLNDIERFIEDYKKCQNIKPKDKLVSIPVIGRVLYQKAALMEMKISAFERGYRKALVGSLEEQEDFIRQMTPVLDDFYAKYSKKSESPKL